MNTSDNGLTQGVVSGFAEPATYTGPLFADDAAMAQQLAAGPVHVNIYGGFFKADFANCQAFGYPFRNRADAIEAASIGRFVTVLYRINVKRKKPL